MRYMYAAVGGSLVGVAGAAYSLDVKLGWSYHYTSGLGWIALAIVIFGGWHPYRVAFGCSTGCRRCAASCAAIRPPRWGRTSSKNDRFLIRLR